MDSLKDWHRYVDSVSRPARREDEEGEPAESLWRPWNATPEDDLPVEAVRAEQVPDLAAALGLSGVSEARQPATPEFQDPTIYDQLQPMLQFSVPKLLPPSFELTIPSLRSPFQHPAPETAHAEVERPAHSSATAVAEVVEVSPVPMEAEPAAEDRMPSLAPGYLERLAQIRGQQSAQASTSPRQRETREKLLTRILDPVLTLEETALLLEVCPTTVRRYTNKGQLKHFRTEGNQRRFRFSDVVEFLESRSAEIEADQRADREAGRQ